MRSNLFLIIFLFFFSPVFAGNSNKWFTIGARGTVTGPFLINSNEYKDNGLKHNFAIGGSGGAMIGFHFNDWGSINVEGLYSIYSRKLKSAVDSLPWTSSTTLTYLEFPILFRAEWNFKYIEGGVLFGQLIGANGSYANEKYPKLDYDVKDIKENLNPSNTAIVFGWGTNLMGDGGLMLSLGIRLTYGLTDIVSDLGGKGKSYYPLADGTAATAQSYKPTNTATVGIHLSLDFDLGYIVSSSCGRKHKFALFGH
ncbi:MAG: PorT family protein [Bacteroidia bacterium]|nr:PorT family protein [Bacteroidia bacterium]